MSSPVQLLVYRFGEDAGFEGHLVGALERMESGGTLKVLDVLFVARDGASGELSAVELRGSHAGGMVAPLLGFRLDLAERRRLTRRAVHSALVTALGDVLEPGHALAAVLVGHEWARALDDAVERTGGASVTNGFVEALSLAALAGELVEAATAVSGHGAESAVSGGGAAAGEP